MRAYREIYQKIISRLNLLRIREKKLNLAGGFITFLIILMSLSISALSVEAIFRLSSQPRLILLSAVLLIVMTSLIWLVVRPLFSIFFRPQSPNDISLALKVGNHFTSIRDRLADALQVFQKHKQNPEGYSLELADTSLELINEEIKDINFDVVADVTYLKKAFKLWLGGLTAFVLITFIFSSDFLKASYRLIHPLRAFPKNTGLTLSVSPGDIEVVKGDHVQISAKIVGAQVSEVILALKKEDAKEFDQYFLSAQQDNQFTFTLENVRDNMNYFVEAASKSSPQYSISVVELPFVRNLQLKLRYPSYSKLGSQFLDENVGDVTALKGTQIEISLMTNKLVNEAKLIFDDKSELPMRISDKELTGRFNLMRDGSYHIKLKDRKDRSNSAPIEYRMTVLEDQFPLVQITFPGVDVDLGDDMLLPLTVEAEDDFGLSKVRIGYRILQGGFQEGELRFFDLELPKEREEKIILNHTWEVSKLDIYPEDIVTYFAEAFDNDLVSGPKSSRSLTYRVRFPSIYEIYEEVARSQEETFEGLEDLYEQSKTLKENLDEIVQEMKKDPELNWEEKQKVQEAVQVQEKMRQKLEQLQENLDEMVSRMEQNDLLSLETLEKYRELQNLMEEMLTPELKEALRKLQKSIEEIDPQKLKEAMEKFTASQEEFLKSLERTLNLLKQLQIEQKLDEAVRKAEELHRRQEELNKKATESPDKQNRSKYAQEQKGIRKDTGDLHEVLDELSNRMNEFPQMPQNRIEAAQNLIQQDSLQTQMQKAIQQFQAGNMSGAQKTGQQIAQNLQELLETLQTAQKELSEKQKQQIMQALNRSSHNLLTLSKQQEKLMQATQGLNKNSPGMNQLADKQQDLLSGLARVTNQLYELSQKTFFVTPEIGKALGRSISGMQSALQSLEARDSGRSTKNQGMAMSGLNEAAAQIRNSMQNLGGASSAIGFQEMMQKLMGLSNKQQGINQQTLQLGENPSMSLEEQAAMSRLAAEQQGVHKSLEQLRKELGNRTEILGDLEQISKDMEEVVKELQRQNVSRQTIDRQKRILSRLLDAQRSMHQRDYSKRRKAETGKEYHALSPQTLPTHLGKEKDRLKEELLKALKEGYSKDYRELIQKYFEALSKEQKIEEINN
ncbi:MAG: DUF4175 family protein [bacterium]